MAIIKNNINFGNQNIKRIYKGNNQITQIWKKVNNQNKLLYYYGDGSQGLTYSDVSVWKATVTNLGAENPNDVVFDVPDNTVEKPWSEVTFNGDTFIRFNKMYRKILTITDNQITSFSISNKKLDDNYEPYPCFIDESGNELDYILVGKYMSKSSDTCNSVAAGDPVSQTISNGREKARARGAGYQIMDWRIYKLWQDLVICAYKKININSGSGLITDVLGLEWDQGSQWVDGLCIAGKSVDKIKTWIYSNSPSKYIDNPTANSDSYAAISGYTMPYISSSQIIQKLGYDSAEKFFNYPSAVSGDTVSNKNTYYCNSYVPGTSTTPINTSVGGVSEGNGIYGAFSCRALNSYDYNTGVRLCYRPIAESNTNKTVVDSSMPKLTVTGKTSVSITHLDIPRYTFEFEDQNRIGTVMAINNQALAHTDSRKLDGSVSILNDIESIGDKAFLDCTGITSVHIGPNIKSIGLAAFACCPSLKTVYWWAENCTEAGNDSYPIFGEYPETEIASMQNTAITQVTIGSNVESLPAYAFTKCKSLSSIAIPNSVTAVGNALLEFSGITSASTGNGLQTISPYMFNNCSNLQKVKLGSRVSTISDHAFQACTSLERLAVPSYLNRIQDNAFNGATDIIGDRIILRLYIEDLGAWCKIQGLSRLMNPHWNNGAAGVGKDVLWHVLYKYSDFNKSEDQHSELISISIPSGVSTIPDHAFYRCSGLTSVTLPSDLSSIGAQAFCDCTKLTSINIPEGVASIGEQAFNSCNKLATLNLPNSLLEIGTAAFMDTAITSLIIPDNVTVLPQLMVSYCTQLESMSIPSGIKKIRANFIRGAKKLHQITYPKTIDEWNAIEKEFGWNNVVSGQSNVWLHCSDGEIQITLNLTD